MLPLTQTTLPPSAPALRDAIVAGFARHQIATREVSVEGGNYPDVESLKVDLSGAKVSRDLRLSRPGQPAQQRISAAKLSVVASPLLLESAPLQFRLEADRASLALAESAPDEGVLVPQAAEKGEISAEIQKADLEQLLRTIASELAGKQGVDIKEVNLELTTLGPRTLAFRAHVVAKMFLMKAPVTLVGQVDVDDQLDLRISRLAVEGSGMAANLVNGFARSHFERVQSQPISLSVLSLGSIRLRNVEIAGGNSLRLRAEFGV